LTEPRVTLNIDPAAWIIHRAPHIQLQESGMHATAMCSLIAVLLALLPVLPVAAQSDPGKTLRLVPHADLTVVDPQFIGVYITRNFGYLVYDTLFGMDREFRPQPQMVDTWQVSDDKLTWTFRLREELKFHDGQPVRATDAVASLKRVSATILTAKRCSPPPRRSRHSTTGNFASF
jgi:ABC-type transport system substrate-binding protein